MKARHQECIKNESQRRKNIEKIQGFRGKWQNNISNIYVIGLPEDKRNGRNLQQKKYMKKYV